MENFIICAVLINTKILFLIRMAENTSSSYVFEMFLFHKL